MKARNTAGRFFKRNRTAQTAYDMAMSHLMPTMAGPTMEGSGMYTGNGLYIGRGGLHSGRGMYTGMGEYQAEANDLLQSSKSTMGVVPQFASQAEEHVIISRREYVSEIFGPPAGAGQAFTLQAFPINPGLERTFPWLSQIAQNYDEYEIHQLVFTFKSTTTESTSATNGQVGMVILNTNYNAGAANFQDKAEMQQYTGVASTRLTESCQHFVECDPTKNSGSVGEYIRANPIIEGQDIKSYDHGKFQIAIANAAAEYANVSLGELWVSYTILLRKPKFFTALGLGITKDIFCSFGTETFQQPFGSDLTSAPLSVPKNLLLGQQNNLGSLLQNLSAATSQIKLTFPATYRGYLKIMLAIEGTTMTGSGVNTLTPTGQVTLISDLYASSVLDAPPAPDAPKAILYSFSATQVLYIIHVKCNIAIGGVDNTLTILTGITGGTIVQSYCDISEYNSGFSYRAANRGPSDAPILVNISGIITVP